MAVSVSDIQALQDKQVYETSNEKYVLSRDYEKIIHSPQYTILGFLNGYMYCSKVSYLSKNTTDGEEIASIKLEVEHAAFVEGSSFFYAYSQNTIYKITENLLTKRFTEYILSTSKYWRMALDKGEDSNVRRNEKTDRRAAEL